MVFFYWTFSIDRAEEKIDLIRKYLQVTKQFRNYNDQSQDPHYTQVIITHIDITDVYVQLNAVKFLSSGY